MLDLAPVESSHARLHEKQSSKLDSTKQQSSKLDATYFFSMADSTTMSSTYACDGASAGGFFTA